MFANAAHFGRFPAYMDMPAVGAEPDCFFVLFEQCPVFKCICIPSEPFGVHPFDFGYVLECMGDPGIAFLLCDNGKIPVNVLPLFVFIVLCRPEQFQRAVMEIDRICAIYCDGLSRRLFQQFIKHLCMRPLLVRRVVENSLDDLQAFLPGDRRCDIIPVPCLAFACKSPHQIDIRSAFPEFHFHCSFCQFCLKLSIQDTIFPKVTAFMSILSVRNTRLFLHKIFALLLQLCVV